MDSFLGAGKKLGQEVKKALKDGASLAQRKARASINWPRDSLSTNTEQELQDLGNVVAGNQTVIQGQAEESPVASGVVVPIGEDLRNLEEGNQTVIQGFGNQDDIEEENQDDIQEIMTDPRVVATLRALLMHTRTQELPGGVESGEYQVLTGESEAINKLDYGPLGFKLLALNVGISYKENSYLFWTVSVIVSLGSALSFVSTFMQRRLPGRRCHYALLCFEALFLIGSIIVTISTFP